LIKNSNILLQNTKTMSVCDDIRIVSICTDY